MKEKNSFLFESKDGNKVLEEDFYKAFLEVGANDCDLLFVHTKLSFGKLNRELKRKDICEALFNVLKSLRVKTLVFPTFTFSYGNREDFDVLNTPTKMGALNEYVRKLPEATRSLDPMMSVVSIGDNKEILNITGVKSLGKGSIFDNLHHTKGVRFLFMGTRLRECGTHMHYIEEQLRVPYRYDKDFYGSIIDYHGDRIEDHRILFVKYRDILPNMDSSYEDYLMEKRFLLHARIGDSDMYSITEEDMYRELSKSLREDVNVFLAEPYDTHPPVKEYKYGNVTTVQ